ncbi:MAG: type II toxin-antitoxin system VapC family toxin [Acidobacteriia bacterium]|nr:type II toxin-antitoxin system VapC family toxin [Terriglobia bacterium]
MVEVVLVDTDVFSFLMKGHTLASQYEKHIKGKKLALSFVTVGELLTWSKHKGWGPPKTAELERRIALTGVIPYDMALCQTYAELNAKLLQAGRKIGDNDLWIAATAIRHSIPLISHNRKHYDDIPDLVFISETPRILKTQMEIEDKNG